MTVTINIGGNVATFEAEEGEEVVVTYPLQASLVRGVHTGRIRLLSPVHDEYADDEDDDDDDD